MKKIMVSATALLIMTATQAQEKGYPRPERAPRFEKRSYHRQMLDRQLKLSEEQQQKAKVVNEDFRKKMMDLRKNEDITVREWKKQMMDLNMKHREDMQNLLTKEQKAQMEKMRADRRKMADIDANARMEKMKLQLDLSNEQMEKMKKQRSEMLEKMKSIHENKSMDNMKKREEMRTLMEKRKENMKSILSEEQMKKLQNMQRQGQGRPKMRRLS